MKEKDPRRLTGIDWFEIIWFGALTVYTLVNLVQNIIHHQSILFWILDTVLNITLLVLLLTMNRINRLRHAQFVKDMNELREKMLREIEKARIEEEKK